MARADRKDQEQRKKIARGALAAFWKEIDGWLPNPLPRRLCCPYCASETEVAVGAVPPKRCCYCGQSWEKQA